MLDDVFKGQSCVQHHWLLAGNHLLVYCIVEVSNLKERERGRELVRILLLCTQNMNYLSLNMQYKNHCFYYKSRKPLSLLPYCRVSFRGGQRGAFAPLARNLPPLGTRS